MNNPIPFASPDNQSEDHSDNWEWQKGIESQLEVEKFLERLSERQRSIIEALMAGYNKKEIAQQLNLTRQTLHREMLHAKRECAIIKSRKRQ